MNDFANNDSLLFCYSEAGDNQSNTNDIDKDNDNNNQQSLPVTSSRHRDSGDHPHYQKRDKTSKLLTTTSGPTQRKISRGRSTDEEHVEMTDRAGCSQQQQPSLQQQHHHQPQQQQQQQPTVSKRPPSVRYLSASRTVDYPNTESSTASNVPLLFPSCLASSSTGHPPQRSYSVAAPEHAARQQQVKVSPAVVDLPPESESPEKLMVHRPNTGRRCSTVYVPAEKPTSAYRRRQSDFSAAELDRAISDIARDSRLSLDKYASRNEMGSPDADSYDTRYTVYTGRPAVGVTVDVPTTLANGGEHRRRQSVYSVVGDGEGVRGSRSQAKISLPALAPFGWQSPSVCRSASSNAPGPEQTTTSPLSDASSSVFHDAVPWHPRSPGVASSMNNNNNYNNNTNYNNHHHNNNNINNDNNNVASPMSPTSKSGVVLNKIVESDDDNSQSTPLTTPKFSRKLTTITDHDDDEIPEILVTNEDTSKLISPTSTQKSLANMSYEDQARYGKLPDQLSMAHSTDDLIAYLCHETLLIDVMEVEESSSSGHNSDNNNDHLAPNRHTKMYPRSIRRYSEDPQLDVQVTFVVGDASPATNKKNMRNISDSQSSSQWSVTGGGNVGRPFVRMDTQCRMEKQTQWRKVQERRFEQAQPTTNQSRDLSVSFGSVEMEGDGGRPSMGSTDLTASGNHLTMPDFNRKRGGLSSIQAEQESRKSPVPCQHRPHQVLVELQELMLSEPGCHEWRQTARWVKYEESLEVGSDKFGRPHVSTLSFHSLLEIRKLIEMGTIAMDMDNVHDYVSLVDELLEVLKLNKMQVRNETDESNILHTLMLPHKHMNDPVGTRITRQRSCNSLQNLNNRSTVCPINDDENSLDANNNHHTSNRCRKSSTTTRGRIVNGTHFHRESSVEENSPLADRTEVIRPWSLCDRVVSCLGGRDPDEAHEVLPRRCVDQTQQSSLRRSFTDAARFTRRHVNSMRVDNELLKRLKSDCEAALMLVGQVDCLESPVILFARLLNSVDMPGIIEVPLPVRFVFIVIGPRDAVSDYHEVGRSISTLIANQNFQHTAYTAEGHADIIRAINEFLDDSIVLPPGDVEQRSLVDFTQIKTRSKNIRERRKALTHRPSDLDHASFMQRKEFIQEQKTRFELDPLRRRGELFGGARREIKHRYKYFKSDFTDAAAWQCVLAIAFIFFTCFFPAVTFGAILGENTHAIGVKETLFATSLCGTIYALLSTQPLLLLGVCGPILAYECSLHQFVKTMHLVEDVDLLTCRLWVAMWAALLCIIVVAFELSFLIRYVTQFADDIMSALISAVFFVECFGFIVDVFDKNQVLTLKDYYSDTYSCTTASCNCSHPSGHVWTGGNSTQRDHINDFNLYRPYQECHQPNTALLTASLVLGTFIVAFCMRRLRNSTYFGRTIRQALGDFSLTVAIVGMIAFDVYVIRDDNLTVKLRITQDFEPTQPSRSWLVSPWPVPLWFIPVSAVAGLLLFMLLFIETEVCQSVFAKKDNMLYKGTGYHWDLLLSGLLLVLCAAFGLPFLCAAPVRSQAHLNSLTSYDLRAPGQKPKVSGVIEQRVTALALHLLMGLCVCVPFILQYLSQIPVAILFGVFLYLGVMNVYGNDMLSRAVLLVVPVKYHPNVPYCMRVRTWRMHLYTFIQLMCFVFVLCIKYIHETAIAFPVAILGAIAVRHKVLPIVFTPFELIQLDGHDEEEEEQRDIYEESRACRMKTRVGP